MKEIKIEENYHVIGHATVNDYKETEYAVPTSRLLDGSRDHGFAAEYVGFGTVDLNGATLMVKAVYLFTEEEMNDPAVVEGDEGSLPWETSIMRFEVVE